MKFIAGLRVWVNGAMGKTPQVFPKIRGSANRRVDLHLPLIASIPGCCRTGRREGVISVTTMTRPSRVIVGADDGETRIRVPGVRYQVYESWVQSLPESTPIRMAYDGRSMELMVKGRKHDNYRELLGEIVRAITQELAIPMSSNGETTWIRPEIERGLEADQSYYF